ncbi:MAG: entry exclusion lipoprotein TrbK [Tatlockia sp.]|nr:entry exclusion lipoprotein TrbK [Tatlockia sp.]
MKHRLVTPLLLLSLLTGCDKPKPLTELTCADSPVGRSKEEQIAIGDACFRRGTFTKSSGKGW